MNITLYRKYRPQTFEEIIGQKYVKKAISNSLKENKLSHAYLFDGPRGTGKTTIARLIAKGVNCLTNGITDNPCGVCDNCTEITKGISMDVIEIDAASNRGIDEIRQLKEKINYQPSKCRKKIYIIDEAHMLTKEAFNALLKTLEEPPSHVIFILATTEIDKIPETVVSRCQRYDFITLDQKEIIELLKNTSEKENINIDEKSLELIYRKSEGSARDSYSIFEQVISNYRNEDITLEKTQEALGVIPEILLESFLKLIQENNKTELIKTIDKLWEDGIIVENFLKDFAYYLKNKIDDEEITTDFILSTISAIYYVLNEFKYEEDKRLIGYVLIYEIFKRDMKQEKVVVQRVVTKEVESKKEVKDNNEKTTSVNVDIGEIKGKWNEFKQSVKKKNIMLAAFIIDSQIVNINNGILTIQLPKNHNFHSEKIMEAKNKVQIEKFIKEFYEVELQIQALVENDMNKKTGGELLNQVMDFFDAEIIEKK